MRTIWKYNLDISEALPVMMPTGAKLLHAGMQDERLCVWAQVNPEKSMVKRLLSVHGTGHDIKPLDRGDGNGRVYPTYVCTFMMHGGMLVFHLFDHGEI